MLKYILILAACIFIIIISEINKSKEIVKQAEKKTTEKKTISEKKTTEKKTISEKETTEQEDSYYLMSILNEKCNPLRIKITDEAKKAEISNLILETVNKKIFRDCRYDKDICYDFADGVFGYPDANFVKTVSDINLIDAVNLYNKIKKYKITDAFPIDCDDVDALWYDPLTLFITNEKDVDLHGGEREKFINNCRVNNVHIVNQNDSEFTDIFDSTKYILNCETQWGMVDDAATYIYYDLIKIDCPNKTDAEKLSDNLLSRIISNCCNKKDYVKDVSLNKINIKVQLEESRMYFLTTYVNASTGIIDEFSFDIESACDTHYEFDIFDAETIKKLCISRLPYNRHIYEKSLDALLTELLKQYGERALIHLVANKSIFTSVDVLDVEEMDNEKYYSRTYKLHESMQIDSMIAVAKEFESENFKFSECYCDTFDENGCMLHRTYYTIDDIAKIEFAPSPYVSFSLNYCDRKTGKYSFSLVSNVNSDVLSYIVDKKRLC